jgi:NodT family efflux transporter outer membrane factor (OMF) lipoprotein
MDGLRSAFIVPAVIAIFGSACAVGPDYHRPKLQLPDSFSGAQSSTARADASGARPVDPATWWRSLGDPDLDSLVDRAIRDNPDLQIALDRLQEARTREVVVLGGALPQINASAGGGIGTGNNQIRGRVDYPLRDAANTRGLNHLDAAAGFDATWELDVFGKYRREIEASHDDALAEAEARNAVLVTVVADLVRAYVDMRGFQIQLTVAQRAVDTAQKTVAFVQARYQGGFTNELDLALAQREMATLHARLSPLGAQVSAAQDTIAVLLGRYPEDLKHELEAVRELPSIPPQVQAGLPLDLVKRRPDVREAERRLAAATARIGVATADLFPHLVATGAIGLQTPGASGGSSTIWSAGPLAFWNFLDFGALDALVDIADLRAREELIAYRAAVITAVSQVDAAVSEYGAQRDRLDDLEAALTASHQAVDLASQRYERGVTDFLNVLDAERQEYQLEDQYALAQASTADAFVALYKALGGGWEGYQKIPPIRRPRPAVVAAFARLFSSDDPQK